VLFDEVEECPPFVFTVWDHDDIGKDEFIGFATVILEKRHLNPVGEVEPSWVPVSIGDSGTHFGKILLSFEAYSDISLIPKNISIEPASKKYYMNMRILGMRNLKSLGILPVKRAFIRFDIDSVRTASEKSSLREKRFLRTEPLDSGPNPNILSVIK